MTARKPQARLTRADERKLMKLLADADQHQVDMFMLDIHRTELDLTQAKARLGKKKLTTPWNDAWHAGYAAAWHEVSGVAVELLATLADDPSGWRSDAFESLTKIIVVAEHCREVQYTDTVPSSWSAEAS